MFHYIDSSKNDVSSKLARFFEVFRLWVLFNRIFKRTKQDKESTN